jgi:hypothetical protein
MFLKFVGVLAALLVNGADGLLKWIILNWKVLLIDGLARLF